MYYILDENIALRSFWLVPYAVYVTNEQAAIGVKRDVFDLLLKCDGLNEIENSPMVQQLVRERTIHPLSKKGEKSLTNWQQYKNIDNRYMPRMNWMITGRCNYNCLHCFNAKDNAPLQSEWSLEEANKLLDEASECGINCFTLTGGEPMVHRNFFDIVKGIYDRHMFVFELNTNGYYINQKSLDRLKEIGCRPLMKISLDSLGFHDWMRNFKGAEQITINAIKLCIENGFDVKVQMNINRHNKDSILKTLEYLDSIGVKETRVIATTNSVRWLANAKMYTFDIDEYYDAALQIGSEYIKKYHRMIVDFWQVVQILPHRKSYMLVPCKGALDNYRGSRPLCQGNRGMIAVGSNGNVYPCLQMSGYMEAYNVHFGNAKKDGLRPLLQGGKYMNEITYTIGDLIKIDGKCRNCKYLKVCRTGCRLLAILTNDGSFSSHDQYKCHFFEHGYIDKFEKAFEGYTNETKFDLEQ